MILQGGNIVTAPSSSRGNSPEKALRKQNHNFYQLTTGGEEQPPASISSDGPSSTPALRVEQGEVASTANSGPSTPRPGTARGSTRVSVSNNINNTNNMMSATATSSASGNGANSTTTTGAVASNSNVSTFMEMQRTFLLTHGDNVSMGLQTALYMMPVNAENTVQLQGINSISEVFQLYKSYVLRNSRGSYAYLISGFLLRAIRCVQCIAEMHRHSVSGKDSALNLCTKLEFLKLGLKLLLRFLQPKQMRSFSKDLEPNSIFIEDEIFEVVERDTLNPKEPEPYVGKRSGIMLPEGRRTRNKRTVGKVAPRNTDSLSIPNSDDTFSSSFSSMDYKTVAAELLYHLRPLVQLRLIKTEKKWVAWVLPVLMEACSLYLLRSKENLTAMEKSEVQRRTQLFWYCLARDPMWALIFEKPVGYLDYAWNKIPGLNYLNIIQICLAFRPYYFTTSGT